MTRRLLLALIAVTALSALAVALPAGARIRSGTRNTAGGFGPNLTQALRKVDFAYWREEAAGSALDEAGYIAAEYGGDVIEAAQDDLDDALTALQRAVSAGEISTPSANELSNAINQAGREDENALDALDLGVSIDHVLSHLDSAEAAKESVRSLIRYGVVLNLGSLGCSLFLAPSSGDVQVGFDGCTTPLSKIMFWTGFDAKTASDALVVANGAIVDRFPCVRSGWSITCTPASPVQTGQGVFIAYDAPAVSTAASAFASGTNGVTQQLDYLVGSGKASTDLGLNTMLDWVTRYGFKTPKQAAGTYRLGVGYQYSFESDVANYGLGTATNATYTLKVPSNFHVDAVSPKICGVSAGVVSCPVGIVPAYYATTVSVRGTVTAPGPLDFTKSLSSDAIEPSPDPHANSLQFAAKAYGLPNTPIVGISPSLRQGKPGTISGTASAGSSFEPALERVTKVEVAILEKPSSVEAKCAWLNKKGNFVRLPKHEQACDKGVWLPVSGLARWTVKFAHGLPRGTYIVLARGANAAGLTNILFDSKRRNEVTLTVR